MTQSSVRCIFFIALSFFSVCANRATAAAQISGAYVLGGHGTLLPQFDGAGNFSGLAALPGLGIGNLQGTAVLSDSGALTGQFTLTDRRTGAIMASGITGGRYSVLSGVLTLTLSAPQPQSFKGTAQRGSEPVPAGQYFGTLLPTSLLFDFARSQNRQVVTLQGDQDFGLDLTQAVTGQLLFNQSGNGYGVVYENGLASSSPRAAFAHYQLSSDKIALTFFSSLFGGTSRTVHLAGTASGGNYDGVYLGRFTADGCAQQTQVVTVKNGVLTGNGSALGTVTGSVSDFGTLGFLSTQFTVPPGCPQSGTHGAVSFTGGAAFNPLFPVVLQGTFSGSGVTGTFTLEDQSGITGATTPGGVPEAEVWAGPMNGTHRPPLGGGGVFQETFQISFNFPSSLVSALRGKSQLLTGSGTLSGSETVKTQAPFPTAISMLVASTVSSVSTNVKFAGVLTGAGPSIEFDSSSVLIPGEVTVEAGPDAGTNQFENRKIIKLRVSSIGPTLIKGAWEDGEFVLRKQ